EAIERRAAARAAAAGEPPAPPRTVPASSGTIPIVDPDAVADAAPDADGPDDAASARAAEDLI
ncbi:MAG TPA: hypothetical protein VHE35_11300, partial [Kofleriaceae bacterium]|nr:hypothetical protein [Kofleriaceae bacterium]